MLTPLYLHSFSPGLNATSVPLVLLHGTGGDERDLVPLATEIAPNTAKLAVRGTVAIEGGFAFFRRFPDRHVDEGDLAARIPALAQSIEALGARYDFARRPIALGFSNGAIMTAALLLSHPTALSGAILFRSLPPFRRHTPQRLDSMPVLIVDGANDNRRLPHDGVRLTEQLVQSGGRVSHYVLPVGHALTVEDKRIASEWLKTNFDI